MYSTCSVVFDIHFYLIFLFLFFGCLFTSRENGPCCWQRLQYFH